jgi:hypothetical protein
MWIRIIAIRRIAELFAARAVSDHAKGGEPGSTTHRLSTCNHPFAAYNNLKEFQPSCSLCMFAYSLVVTKLTAYMITDCMDSCELQNSCTKPTLIQRAH